MGIESLSTQGFIDYVNSIPDSKPINHKQGWYNCSLGEYLEDNGVDRDMVNSHYFPLGVDALALSLLKPIKLKKGSSKKFLNLNCRQVSASGKCIDTMMCILNQANWCGENLPTYGHLKKFLEENLDTELIN